MELWNEVHKLEKFDLKYSKTIQEKMEVLQVYKVYKSSTDVLILVNLYGILQDLLKTYCKIRHKTPIYDWVFHVVSFPQVSPPKPCMHLFSVKN